MTLKAELTRLVQRRLGIRLQQQGGQWSHLERFLGARAAELGLSSPLHYLQTLAAGRAGGEEFDRMVSLVTNSFSFFFRDPQQFAAISELLQTHQRSRGERLSIWSAGCSTGEEAYSLAMLCADLHLDAHLLATDVNRAALELARTGRYSSWALRHLPAGYATRFFREAKSSFWVQAPIRRRVQFAQQNLLEDECPAPPGGRGWDLVLCRNVLLFFDASAVARVISKLASCLSSDGWLFLSSAESLGTLSTPLRLQRIRPSFGYRHGSADAPDEPDLAASRTGGAASHWPATPTSSPLAPEAAPSDHGAAIEHLEAGRLAEAENVLTQILARDDGDLLAHLNLGNLCLRQHDIERALGEYGRAQAIAPLLPEVSFFQGLAHRKSLDWERAVCSFRQTLFLQASFWPASFLLAGVFARLSKEELRRGNLTQTLASLRQPPEQLFISHVGGVREASMDPDEVAGICDRLLRTGARG